jgi:hypothetical protein
MNELNVAIVPEISFFRLPLKTGTFDLDLETLDRYCNFRIPKKPYLNIQIRKIDYINEVWIFGVKLNKEEEEKVYIKVTATALLVSCSVDTDESYLSRYVYCLLYRLLFPNDEYNFEDYYWPDLVDERLQKKFLMVLKSRDNVSVLLKVRYHGLYKLGKHLPRFEMDQPMLGINNVAIWEKACTDHKEVIGYSLSHTNLDKWRSTNHYPFLAIYKGVATKDRAHIKGFKKFILNEYDLNDYELCPIQEKLNSICFAMRANALVKVPSYKASEEEKAEIERSNNENYTTLFTLWQQAFPLLPSKLHTHYHFTYGMRNVKGKPVKSRMNPCTFNHEPAQLCFLWKEKPDYYKLELRFLVAGCLHEVPHHFDTAYFIASTKNPLDFHLLNTLMDTKVLSFFSETNFRILVLKAHYHTSFKEFVEQLRTEYKFING